MDSDDAEMQRLWDLVTELSEQLSQNRALTASLQAQVSVLKVREPIFYYKSIDGTFIVL